MESLLTYVFDRLTKPDTKEIRRGLKQLTGLLSQICLTLPSSPTEKARPKSLSNLSADPAFRSFSLLQNHFQFNVCIHLVQCLERLLGKESTGEIDILVIQCLETLVCCLLVHSDSRELWAREANVNLFLDLLDPSACAAIQIATLHALIAALLDHPANARVFEQLDGLQVVTSLFKAQQTSLEVKREIIEFCYFYLGAETVEDREYGTAGVLGGKKQEVLDAFRRASKEQQGGAEGVGGPVGGDTVKPTTRTRSEKEALLGRYLDNVKDLVEDMKEAPSYDTAERRTSVIAV